MCITNAKPVRLTGPMKVYKVLVLVAHEDGIEHAHSPYRAGTTWKMGERNTILPTDESGKYPSLKDAYDDMSPVEEIHGGAFHSFTEREAAEMLAKSLRENVDYRIPASGMGIVISECVVPEDSAYVFEGDFDVPVGILPYGKALVIPRKSIASSSLILERILEDDKNDKI